MMRYRNTSTGEIWSEDQLMLLGVAYTRASMTSDYRRRSRPWIHRNLRRTLRTLRHPLSPGDIGECTTMVAKFEGGIEVLITDCGESLSPVDPAS